MSGLRVNQGDDDAILTDKMNYYPQHNVHLRHFIKGTKYLNGRLRHTPILARITIRLRAYA